MNIAVSILVVAATLFIISILLILTEISKRLKAINVKLLNIEMTVRKSPEGAYIRIGNSRNSEDS